MGVRTGNVPWQNEPVHTSPIDRNALENIENVLDSSAPIDSPELTGVPTVPTPGPTSNDFSIPNTAWVRSILPVIPDGLPDATGLPQGVPLLTDGSDGWSVNRSAGIFLDNYPTNYQGASMGLAGITHHGAAFGHALSMSADLGLALGDGGSPATFASLDKTGLKGQSGTGASQYLFALTDDYSGLHVQHGSGSTGSYGDVQPGYASVQSGTKSLTFQAGGAWMQGYDSSTSMGWQLTLNQLTFSDPTSHYEGYFQAGNSLGLSSPGRNSTLSMTGLNFGSSGGTGQAIVWQASSALTFQDYDSANSVRILMPYDNGTGQNKVLQIPAKNGMLAVLGDQPAQAKSANYTLATGDTGTTIEETGSSATTITVPPNSSQAFELGATVEICQMGTGQITVAAGAGVTLRSPGGLLHTRVQYSTIRLRKRATDEWVLSGDVG